MKQASAQRLSSTEAAESQELSAYGKRRLIGLFLGPAAFILMLILPLPPGMSPEAAKVAATTFWIAIWWVTEPIPIPATSLLPLVLLPITGALPVGEAASGYSHYLIFVFVGGFMIALALERWGLHRRIALFIISIVGASPMRMVLGFMAATGFLSMWISNTATAMMMLPIGTAVIWQMGELLTREGADEESTERQKHRFATALMLGIAYSASIGGIGTLIGTPPNLVLAGAADELLGIQISFARWMIVGTPLAVFGILLVWLYLTRIAYPLSNKTVEGAMDVIKTEQRKLGGMSRAEWSVLVIFGLVAFAWITRKWFINPFFPEVNDAVIAITGAVLLFTVPLSLNKNEFILDWDTAKNLPWGIVLLFGAGLSIAGAFQSSGLTEWLGNSLSGLSGLPIILTLLVIVTMVIFLTELTSNTASATMLMPIMASLGAALSIAPLLLMVPVAIAASCAFMMPVATPPNAIVFGSGNVSIQQMAKTGFFLNLLFIAIVTAIGFWVVPMLWS